MRPVLSLVLLLALNSLACKPAPAPPSTASAGAAADLDNRLLSLALSQAFNKGGYTVVDPDTGTGHLSSDPKELAQVRKYVAEGLKVPGADVPALLDAFLARNARSVRLTLPSAPERGYLVDYEGTYRKYFENDGGSWPAWHRDHPEAHGSTSVSLPLYDKQAGVVLLTLGTQYDGKAGAGYLIAYRYDGTTLGEISRVMLWIS